MWLVDRFRQLTTRPAFKLASPPIYFSGLNGKARSHDAMAKSIEKENRGIAKLVNEIECDYQFNLGMLTIKALVESIPVSVNEQADLRARALAANLLRHWRETLCQSFRSFAYGRAAFEKTYRRDGGLVLLDSLDYLPFELTEMVLDEHGDYDGVKVKPKGGGEFVLPAESTWWMALDPTPTEPHGRSRYLGAPFEVFKQRQDLAKQFKIWYQRFAIGHGVARFPEPDGPEDFREEDHPKYKMAAMLAQIESGGIALLSSLQYANSDGSPTGTYQYDYQPSPGMSDATPLSTRLQSLDAQALRSLGVPERAVTQDESTGSYSMAEAHQLVLFATCDGIMEQLTNSFERHVINAAIKLNYQPGNQPSIRLAWKSLREQAMERKEAEQKAKLQPPVAPFGPRTMATKPAPVKVATPEELAERAARENAVIWAELEAACADRDNIDRGRL